MIMSSFYKKYSNGFTIVELITVIVIIGILSAITIVGYQGIQGKSLDASVLSDLDTLDAIETNYGLKNHVSAKPYYSGNGPDSDLNFTPSSGNVIDVVANSSDYCIRGYNPNSTKNSITNPYIKESKTDIC